MQPPNLDVYTNLQQHKRKLLGKQCRVRFSLKMSCYLRIVALVDNMLGVQHVDSGYTEAVGSALPYKVQLKSSRGQVCVQLGV